MTTFIPEYNPYVFCVKNELSLDPSSWSFKKIPAYTNILEHCSPQNGYQYLAEIIKHFESYFLKDIETIRESCKLNDLYGNPRTFMFQNFMNCSPTNLRYILHTYLILQNILDNHLTEVDFIEIGGGYGGLSLFIHKILPLYNITIKSYTIFDLPFIIDLQKKYLNLHDIHIQSYTLESSFSLQKNSYLISNYAFSEITNELQKEYIDKVINPYVNYGFLCWNHIEPYPFIKDHILKITDEYPNTGSFIPNKYIYIESNN